MDTITNQARDPEVIEPGIGHHLHFLNHRATIKVRGGGSGRFSVVEFEAARGIGPPLHVHADEDELFLVHDGEVTFHQGSNRWTLGAGGVAYLPATLPHTFQVRSTTARYTCVTASHAGSPTFDRMVAALGETVAEPSLPVPGYVDATQVADVCRQFGIEVIGPPPAPLD
jgi:quercetin dioxygenase-like cupin family protein